MTTRFVTAALAVAACSSPRAISDGDPGGDAAIACTQVESLPALPPLGERRCQYLGAGQTWDPAKPGPFSVGVKTLSLADPLRPGRTLVTEVWYPAAESARGGPGTGYDVALRDIANMLGVPIPFDIGSIELVHTDAVRDAPRAPVDAATGLVVFSHGFRGVRWQSTFLTVALASHGYVVAAPDHQGNTMFDGSSPPEQSAQERIEDMSFVTTEMIARTRDPASFFAASFDPRRVGWIGHSFGASTVIMAGAFDNRELVAIPLAPAFDARMALVYNQLAYDLRAATVVIGGTADTTVDFANQQLAYDRTVAPRYLAALDGAQHFDFTDLCANDILLLIPQIRDSCGASPKAAQAATRALAIAALHRYVRCDPAADAWLAPTAGLALSADRGAPPVPPETARPLCDLAGADAAPAHDVTVGTLHVRIRGADAAPPLVFVHGFSTTGAVFQHQLDVLSRRYRVVAIDLRGHGGSPPDPAAPFGVDATPGTADDPYAIARFADDVDAVIDQLQLARPIVIGWSSGGQVALEVARRSAPGRLRGLIVVDATPLTLPDVAAHPLFAGGGTLAFARELHSALAAPNQGAATWRPVVEDFVADPAPAPLVDGLLAIVATIDNATRLGQILAPRADLVDALDAIAVPTLVIHGEQDDALLLESARYLAAHIPNARLEVFQRSGHAPFAEEPERFDLVVDAFVRGLAP